MITDPADYGEDVSGRICTFLVLKLCLHTDYKQRSDARDNGARLGSPYR